MKIVRIEAAGLRGATPEGGWANEIKPERLCSYVDRCLHR